MPDRCKKADWWIYMSGPGLKSMGARRNIQRMTELPGQKLPESTIVSMNMWGFTKSILGELENRFGAFLDKKPFL